MDLPYDVKELIASNLSGPDLVNISKVDSEFKRFFTKLTAPVFREEFIRISKILPYLRRIHSFKPTSEDIRDEGSDAGLLSFVLSRDVGEGEIFKDEFEYQVWRTALGVVDLDASFSRVVEEFNYNKYLLDLDSQPPTDFWDEYFFKHQEEIPYF